MRELDWDAVDGRPASTAREIEAAARMFQASDATVVCWAMGITQHRNAVATIKEIVNVALLQGNIGKPGAGLCPVRGHSNVQGDRTMGIWEQAPEHFLDALQEEFGFDPPREHGLDTVEAIEALRDGKAKVFVGMGGNFVSAAPDTEVTEQAMRNADLTVHVSTKLNRSHVVTGREALILPALGRTERDLTGGRLQRVTVEDSMSAVHASHGPLKPAAPYLQVRGRHRLLARRSPPSATGTASRGTEFRSDYTEIRHRIARVVPGCAAYDEKVEPARRLRAAAPAAGLADVPDRGREGASSRSARSTCCTCPRAGCCCRRCAATTSSTPRSTASTTATAASRTAAGWCSSTPTTSPRSASPTARSSTWSASGPTAPSAARPSSGWCLRPAARLRGGVLPGDEPAGPAGLHGHRQQQPDVEVGHRAARAAGRRSRASPSRATPDLSRRVTRSGPSSRSTCAMSNLEEKPPSSTAAPRRRPASRS